MSDTIRVSIGSEPMQWLGAKVLESSILRRTARKVKFTYSWMPKFGWSPTFGLVRALKHGTMFNTWRWLVPHVYGYEGTAIYLDADQVVLADIAELFDTPLGDKCFGAVIGAEGYFDKPKNGKPILPDAIQTSVMVMNLERCLWDPKHLIDSVHDERIQENAYRVGKTAYKTLMQAGWLRKGVIERIDPEWNHFNIHEGRTKLLHWTYVRNQPYRNPKHPTAYIFKEELAYALESGHITLKEVKKAVAAKYIHKHYLGV